MCYALTHITVKFVITAFFFMCIIVVYVINVNASVINNVDDKDVKTSVMTVIIINSVTVATTWNAN